MSGKVSKDEEEVDHAEQPEKVEAPDGGWGWMIVIGCAVMHFLLGGNKNGFSVLYPELMTMFGQDAAITTLLHGSRIFVSMAVCGPLSAVLMNRFGARPVVMLGGAILGLGVVLSAYPPRFSYLFFSYSLLAGVGGSFVYTPGLVTVGQYFNKRRAIAIGIASAGSGLGAFCFPPLIEFLLIKYSYSGAMLLLGAIQLNNIVAGALYRPLQKIVVPHKKQEQEKLLDIPAEKIDADPVQDINRENIGASAVSINTELGHGDSFVALNRIDNCDATDRHQRSINSNYNDESVTKIKTRTSATPSCWKSCRGQQGGEKKKLLNLELLKDSSFVLFGIAMGLNVMNYLSAQMLVPALAKEKGIGDWEGAFLVSIIGICDVLTRVASGFIMDARCVRNVRRHVFNASMLVTGLASFFYPFAQNYSGLVVCSVMSGLSCGMMIAQRAVVLADMLGVERLASSVSLMNLFNGIGAMVGPAVAGLIKDVSCSYTGSYFFCGTCSFLASLLFLVDHIRKSPKCSKSTSDDIVKNDIVDKNC